MSEQNLTSWIAEQRTLHGISQVDIAQALRVSQATVSNWERGKSYPDEVQLEAMEKLFRGETQVTEDVDGLDEPHANGWGGNTRSTLCLSEQSSGPLAK